MTDIKIDPGLLRKIPLFSSLSDRELEGILSAPENGVEEFGPKQVIVREMEVAQSMYVILDGIVEVTLRGGDASGREVPIATLRPGDFFGDQALVESSRTGRRSATVRSLNKAVVFRIDKQHVRLALHKGDEEEDEPTVPHMSKQDREVRDLIKGMRLFQSLKESELASIGTWTSVEQVGPGDFVLKESDKGDCLYVVLDGTVEIVTFDDDGKIVLLATHSKGEYFGEQSLMPGSDGKRNAYARSNGLCRLIKVPKAYFRLVLNRDGAVAEALRKVGEKQKTELDRAHKPH